MAEKRTAVISVKLPLWAAALRGLAERSDLNVVGSARDTEQSLTLIAQLRPDVFIAEVDLGQGSLDLDLVRAARRLSPDLRVIVLSRERDRSSVVAAFGAGADLYVLHDADPDDLSAGLRQLFRQSIFVAANWAAPSALRSVPFTGTSLTRREFEILQLVTHGYTNSTMASMLTVTEQTIKFHLSNIYRKLEVSNRTEASRWAQVHGLLPTATSAPVEAVSAHVA
jgi:DNA-binding NarL/FixJ family response regulator